MPTAPVGAVVTIAPYDHAPEPCPEPGDYLLSTGGTAYRVLEARPTTRPGRCHLTCLKTGTVDSIPTEATAYPLVWYSRAPRHRP